METLPAEHVRNDGMVLTRFVDLGPISPLSIYNSISIYPSTDILIGKHRTDGVIGDSSLPRLLILQQQFLAAFGYRIDFNQARINHYMPGAQEPLNLESLVSLYLEGEATTVIYRAL